ncbi:MAG: hypothetical protein V1692_02605 [bacterium]
MLFHSKEELEKFLQKEIIACNGLIVFQIGHFALVYDKDDGKLVPAIYEEIKNKELNETVKEHPYMGSFPLETWKIGTDLVKFAFNNSKESNIVVAINDWQWVPKVESGARNTLKDKFYKTTGLPDLYQKELEKNKLSSNIILPMLKNNGKIRHKLFFSESSLRKLYSRNYAEVCELGKNQCAQEYVPLLNQISKYGAKLFISFIPKTCAEPVIKGSEEVKSKFGSDIKIINVFANGVYKKDFYENINIAVI